MSVAEAERQLATRLLIELMAAVADEPEPEDAAEGPAPSSSEPAAA